MGERMYYLSHKILAVFDDSVTTPSQFDDIELSSLTFRFKSDEPEDKIHPLKEASDDELIRIAMVETKLVLVNGQIVVEPNDLQ